MTLELRQGAFLRLLVVSVLLSLVFMHGLSGSAFGAAVSGTALRPAAVAADALSKDEVTTTASSSVAMVPPAVAAAVFAVDDLTAVGDWAQADDDRHSKMGLTGLCLALLTVTPLTLAAARLRPGAVLGGGPRWLVLLQPRRVRCRAPKRFALGVHRC